MKRLTRGKREPKRSEFRAPPDYAEPFTWKAEDGYVIAQRPNGKRYRTRERVLQATRHIERDEGLFTHNDVTKLARHARNAIDLIYRLNIHFLSDEEAA